MGDQKVSSVYRHVYHGPTPCYDASLCFCSIQSSGSKFCMAFTARGGYPTWSLQRAHMHRLHTLNRWSHRQTGAQWCTTAVTMYIRIMPQACMSSMCTYTSCKDCWAMAPQPGVQPCKLASHTLQGPCKSVRACKDCVPRLIAQCHVFCLCWNAESNSLTDLTWHGVLTPAGQN